MTLLDWALALDHASLLKTAAAVLLIVCLQLYLNSRRGPQQAARDAVPEVHAASPVAAAAQQPEAPQLPRAPAAPTYERGGLVKQFVPGPKPQEPPGASAQLLPQDDALEDGQPLDLPDMPWDWRIEPEQLEFKRRPDGSLWELGGGAYGRVYKAVLEGIQTVAVKKLIDTGPRQQQKFAQEIAILRSCRSENIVCFLGALMEPGCTSLVMEFVPFGNLFQNIQNDMSHQVQWWQRGKQIALDIARGLVFLHSRKIIHLDLKSHNVLLGRGGIAKIADVGLAKLLSRSATVASGAGTFDWAAPEMLAGEPCTEKADIYSFGVVLWELCSLEAPALRQTRELKVPEECPKQVANLIAKCKSVDPKHRPSARQCFEVLRKAAILKKPQPGDPQQPDYGANHQQPPDSRASLQQDSPPGMPSFRGASLPLGNARRSLEAARQNMEANGVGAVGLLGIANAAQRPTSIPEQSVSDLAQTNPYPLAHMRQMQHSVSLQTGGSTGGSGTGGRRSNGSFNHTSSDDGHRSELLKQRVIGNAMYSWAEAVALSAGDLVPWTRDEMPEPSGELFKQIREKYAWQVRKRLLDDSSHRSSTAFLEHMVSAFRQFMSLVGQYDVNLFQEVFIALHQPVDDFQITGYEEIQEAVTPSQKALILANWTKLCSSKQQVEEAQENMLKALDRSPSNLENYNMRTRRASEAADALKAALHEESSATWQFVLGWMAVFTTKQVACWQLEVANGRQCVICQIVEDSQPGGNTKKYTPLPGHVH